MKIVELLNSIRVPVTNEEADLLGKFSSTDKVFKKDLSEREHYLAGNLVNKSVLSRHKKNDQIYYKKASRI